MCEQQEPLRYLGHGAATRGMRACSEWANSWNWRILSMCAPSKDMKPSLQSSYYCHIASLSHYCGEPGYVSLVLYVNDLDISGFTFYLGYHLSVIPA